MVITNRYDVLNGIEMFIRIDEMNIMTLQDWSELDIVIEPVWIS